MSRRAWLWILLAGLVVARAGGAQVELLPNLRPLPPSEPQLVLGFPSGVQLRFGTLTSNQGLGAMEIQGGLVVGETQEVWQCVYTDAGTCNLYPAGIFVHHPEHGHIHLEDYALYRLDPVDPGNPVAGVGSKVSFCLLDSEELAVRLPGAPRKPQYTSCGAEMQGISAGWFDWYPANLPGQSIDVTDFPAGEYLLSIVVDPEDHLHELDDSDNTSSLRIYMDPATLRLEVLGEFDPAALSVASLFPAEMGRGESMQVTITGTGFDPGSQVRFTGRGALKVSDVVLQDGSTLLVTVTTGTGGPDRPRSYDLWVGDAVLPGALTVLP